MKFLSEEQVYINPEISNESLKLRFNLSELKLILELPIGELSFTLNPQTNRGTIDNKSKSQALRAKKGYNPVFSIKREKLLNTVKYVAKVHNVDPRKLLEHSTEIIESNQFKINIGTVPFDLSLVLHTAARMMRHVQDHSLLMY